MVFQQYNTFLTPNVQLMVTHALLEPEYTEKVPFYDWLAL
jgi:hypothetical protein